MPAFCRSEGSLEGWALIEKDCSCGWVYLWEQEQDEERVMVLRVLGPCGFDGGQLCLEVAARGSETIL